MDVFSFPDYKAFLAAKVKENEGLRGYKSQLATAAGCQVSYFSGVLHRHLHLTHDQALGLAEFWGLGEAETDYFLELIAWAKASTPRLRQRIEARLRGMRDARADLSAKARQGSLVDTEALAAYYASWLPSALHILAAIPRFARAEAMAERLQVPRADVEATLSRLAQMGLVTRNGEAWRIVPGGLHLSKGSPFITWHHGNWRQRAMLDAMRGESPSLHYTAVQSHAVADWEALRSCFLEAVERSRAIVKPSANEELSCVCLDVFRV